MTGIPDDIMKAAGRILLSLKCRVFVEHYRVNQEEFDTEIIARAIMEERQRCAEIAEEYAMTYAASIAEGIAAAIKNG